MMNENSKMIREELTKEDMVPESRYVFFFILAEDIQRVNHNKLLIKYEGISPKSTLH